MSSPIAGELPVAGSECAPGQEGYDSSNAVPLALVQQGVAYIILYSTLSTLLFVLLCVLLMKDGLTAAKRRTPIAWVLGFSMLLGVIGSSLDTVRAPRSRARGNMTDQAWRVQVFWATQMLRNTSSAQQTASYYIASNAMLFIVPWVTRWAMTLRIASFYPDSLAGKRKRATVVAFPIAMQVINLVAFSIVLRDGYNLTRAAGGEKGKLFSTADNVTRVGGYRLMLDLLSYGAALATSLYFNVFMISKFAFLGGAKTQTSPGLSSRPNNIIFTKLQQFGFFLAFSYLVPTSYLIALIVGFCTFQGRPLGFMLVINVYVHVFSATLACLSGAAKWRNRESHYYPTHMEGRSLSVGDASAVSGCPLATGVGVGNGNHGGSVSRIRNFGRKEMSEVTFRANDSDQLHAVETFGGDVMAYGDWANRRMAPGIHVPQGIPVSESKLLLHQRRRASRAVPSIYGDEIDEEAQHGGRFHPQQQQSQTANEFAANFQVGGEGWGRESDSSSSMDKEKTRAQTAAAAAQNTTMTLPQLPPTPSNLAAQQQLRLDPSSRNNVSDLSPRSLVPGQLSPEQDLTPTRQVQSPPAGAAPRPPPRSTSQIQDSSSAANQVEQLRDANTSTEARSETRRSSDATDSTLFYA